MCVGVPCGGVQLAHGLECDARVVYGVLYKWVMTWRACFSSGPARGFMGTPYTRRVGQDSLCERLKRKLEYCAGEAAGFREDYATVVRELAVLCDRTATGPGFLRDLLASAHNDHIQSIIIGSGADISPQLDALIQAAQPSVSSDAVPVTSRFHSGFTHAKVDILTYAPDEAKGCVVLKLTDDASRVLAALRSEGEGVQEPGAHTDLLQRAQSLLQRADSMSAFFDKSTMAVLHCLIHLIRAIIRTTKYAPAFKSLPDRVKRWCTIVALKLIVTAFGRAWGPREMPFFGPKDALRGTAYHAVVLQVLTREFIQTDTSLWPAAWTQDGVVQLRTPVAADTPIVGPRAGQRPVHVLEIWAACTLVISVRIYADRLIVAGGGGSTASGSAASSAAVDLYDEDDADDEDDELNREIAETAKQMEDDANAGGDEGGGSGEGADSIVMHGDEDTFETDEAVTTTLIRRSETLQPAPVTPHFRNPLYVTSARGGSGRGKADVVEPIASLVKYHGSLWMYTSASLRGLLPAAVWHTSHVEESFKDQRAQTGGKSMSIADYVATRCSLLRYEQESFDASRAEATRAPLTRQARPQTEGYKGQADATKCGFKMPGGKYCTSKPTPGCDFGRCKRGGHCEHDDCAVHGNTAPAGPGGHGGGGGDCGGGSGGGGGGGGS
jgi:hypothetical protein